MMENKYGLDPYKMPVIGIDFDGTIVVSKFPGIGDPIPRAIETINKWYDEGFWIVIHSCRSGDREQTMRDWLDKNNVKYHTINENLPHRIKRFEADPRKLGVDINIDDKNIGKLGAPLNEASWVSFKLWVDYIMENKHGKSD